MNVRIDNGLPSVTIESVAVLYEEFNRMDVPAYYFEGGANPFAGRCRLIPKTASFYAIVPAKDASSIQMAQGASRGLEIDRRETKSGRRSRAWPKVREVPSTKHEINYNQFAPVSDVVVLYV